MHEQHLRWLRCPQCQERLSPSDIFRDPIVSDRIVSGRLTDSSGHAYRIDDGVPRLLFVEEGNQGTDSLESFNFQYGLAERIFAYDVVRVRHIVSNVFEISKEAIEGKSIYVIGCGNGAELRAFSELGADIVIGIDLTSSIGDAAQNNKGLKNVCVIQADAMHPPFIPETFDLIYSDGVLPHTPDPLAILAKNLRTLNKGGLAYIRTLLVADNAKAKLYLTPRALLRRLTTKLPSRLLWALCWLPGMLNQVPVIGWLARKTFVYQDWRHRDAWTTRLVNFRMYGRHDYRRPVCREDLLSAVQQALPQAKARFNKSLLVVELD